MKFSERIKRLLESEEVRDTSHDLLLDAVSAILGDPISAVKVLNALRKMPAFIQQELLWAKMEAFIDGLDLDEEDIRKLGAIFEENGDKTDNALRLISCIEKADSIKKIGCFVNATLSLINGFINREKYFRICLTVSNTLLEDLQFLQQKIHLKDFSYSETVQGLISSGLMFMSSIQETPSYSFTPFAIDVDKYAISYGDNERYSYSQDVLPNPVTIRLSVYPEGLTWEPLKSRTYKGDYT